MFVCPNCNVENRDNAKFCRKCGRARGSLEASKQGNNEPAESAPIDVKEPQPEVVKKEMAAPNSLPVIERTQRIDDSSPQCPSCWTSLRSTDKFCCWCGAPQPNRVLPFFKLCLECNTQLPERANFCYSCGVRVIVSSRLNVKPPVELFRDEGSEFFPTYDA